MERREIEGNLDSIKVNLQKLNLDSIFRDQLGTQSLSRYKDKHGEFLRILDVIIDNTEEISLKTLTSFHTLTIVYYSFLQKFSTYNDIQFVNERRQIINEYNNHYEELKSIWQQVAAVVKDENNVEKFAELESKIHESITIIDKTNSQLQSDVDTVQNLKSSLEQQIDEYRERYSSINTNVELETQVNVFEAQANKNKENSSKWLIGVIGAGISLVVLLIVMYCNLELPTENVDNYTKYNKVCTSCGQQVLWVDMIRFLLFKLLILSANIYILSFCIKNYLANMHNKTNNEQRHNSFAAALHFYNTTTGERREEILHKVADAIFTYQKSGYYGKDSEPANPSIIQGVVEKVTGKS